MEIGNNYMVSTKLVNGLYHNEYFIDEKSAIAYANECYCLNGSTYMRLKTVDGYRRHTARKNIQLWMRKRNGLLIHFRVKSSMRRCCKIPGSIWLHP